MDESTTAMSETDIIALKETLQAQQELLQTLYGELDQEREASASAASEALSMILRLQGEKAAVQMEANQYKRLAEEKMSHAENSLWVFEDLIYQKEMEIASLEFQLQAYRCKLLSMGCSDVGANDSRFPENLFLQRSDSCKVETGSSGSFRRLNSLPPIPLKDGPKKDHLGRQLSSVPLSDLIPKIGKQNTEQEVKVQNLEFEKKSGNFSDGNFDSYWKKIKALDERVKEISDCKLPARDNSANLKGEQTPCSLSRQVSVGKLSDLTREEITTNLEQVKLQEDIKEREVSANSASSSSVQDIFEVPQSNENRKANEYQKKEWSALVLEAKNRRARSDLIPEDTFRLNLKDETDGKKKVLLCANCDNKLSKERNGAGFDSNVDLVHGTRSVSESEAKYAQLLSRIECLERDKNYSRQEITEVVGEEELKLLKEIREQVKTIQTELRSWITKKSSPQEEQALASLSEAMLHFWL